MDRKSTSGIYTFVGSYLTSWFSKKQTDLAISTTEAEYVSAGKACQQALWMKQALIDYDIRLDDVPIICDNKGVIDLSKDHFSGEQYVRYDRVMYPLAQQHERKTRKDYGTKRGRHSTSASSSSAFDHPSSSHHIDKDNDENDEGTSQVSTPSPTAYVNSLSNDVP
ncbi:hypothetical protein Tco_1383460 [Tanacetum coccineum]